MDIYVVFLVNSEGNETIEYVGTDKNKAYNTWKTDEKKDVFVVVETWRNGEKTQTDNL
jgi:Tol biopolymer transport system component